MIARSALFTTFGLALCAFTACGPSPIKRSLEVTALRYDTTNLTDCGGEMRNISPHAITDLHVLVEFQNADGNRVRTGTSGVSPATLTPGARSGSFPLSTLKDRTTCPSADVEP